MTNCSSHLRKLNREFQIFFSSSTRWLRAKQKGTYDVDMLVCFYCYSPELNADKREFIAFGSSNLKICQLQQWEQRSLKISKLKYPNVTTNNPRKKRSIAQGIKTFIQCQTVSHFFFLISHLQYPSLHLLSKPQYLITIPKYH